MRDRWVVLGLAAACLMVVLATPWGGRFSREPAGPSPLEVVTNWAGSGDLDRENTVLLLPAMVMVFAVGILGFVMWRER
ncbi:MAG: hypothetical protein AAF602_31240 [Myxococcota bacterium]